jgi:hypothetical protein
MQDIEDMIGDDVDYFSSGIWFDERTSSISGWFNDVEMKAIMEAGYFEQDGSKEINLKVNVFAAGSEHADAQ